MANLDLSKYGITDVKEVLHNPSYDVLFAEETKPGLEGFEKGQVTELGAVNVMTGVYTGRSPKDKFFVKNDCCHDALGEEFAAGTCVNVVGVQQLYLVVRAEFLHLVGHFVLTVDGQTFGGSEGQGQGLGVAVQAVALLYLYGRADQTGQFLGNAAFVHITGIAVGDDRTALEFQAVVQRTFTFSRLDSHCHKTCCNHSN